MYKKIYLVRHGQIDAGKEKRYIGITDYPLCEEGIIQSEKLRKYFSQTPIDKVYTSPLKRCIQTTEIILKNRNIKYSIIDDFKEINMGKWENITFKNIKEKFPLLFEERGKNFADFIPPEGESFNQLSERVCSVYDKILKSQFKNTVIVAHAGVNRVILCKLLGIPLNDLLCIKQPFASVYELTFNDENLYEYKILDI